MTNEHDPVEPIVEQQAYQGDSPGTLLRKAREARGLSQQQLADSLRLRVVIVQYMETDAFDKLASPTFVRGYLRSLSKALETDPAPIFEAFEKMGFDAPTNNNVKLQSFSKRKVRERSDFQLKWISYALIIIVIGLAVAWWAQQSDFSWDTIFGSDDAPTASEFRAAQEDGRITVSNRPANSVSSASSTTEEQGTIAEGEAEPMLESAVQASDLSTATMQEAEPNSDTLAEVGEQPSTLDTAIIAPAATPAVDASEMTADQSDPANETITNEGASEQAIEPAAAAATATGTDSLTMVFSDRCWVRVIDATGETIAIGEKVMGYEMPLTGTAPFDIILCKPEAVTLTYNGESVDLSEYRRNRSVTMTLN
ncbi:MAG TPA: RodZ domain-containing protein [Pseudidiomarina sp.]|nr:RodZ domain-containing protein [Pseudidiomarina sp.]